MSAYPAQRKSTPLNARVKTGQLPIGRINVSGSQTIRAKSICLQHGASSITLDQTGVSINSTHISLLATGSGATQAVARQGDWQKCPKFETPEEPHVGGEITSGSSNVMINGKPAARLGDSAHCGPVTATITAGASGVMINAQPIARVKDKTDHNGQITQGSSNVSVGEQIMKASSAPS